MEKLNGSRDRKGSSERRRKKGNRFTDVASRHDFYRVPRFTSAISSARSVTTWRKEKCAKDMEKRKRSDKQINFLDIRFEPNIKTVVHREY